HVPKLGEDDHEVVRRLSPRNHPLKSIQSSGNRKGKIKNEKAPRKRNQPDLLVREELDEFLWSK
ncbi:hypothetical protein, partial [Haemophilus sp. SZY H54]